jgi:amidase
MPRGAILPRVEPTDLAYAGAAAQADLIARGEVSARDVVQACLDRIERLDPRLNAFRAVYAERALVEADQATARAQAGERRPLLGVPVAVKDNMDVAGDVTTHGTDAYGEPAAQDSEIVRRVREAGGIPIGRTHLPELAVWPETTSPTWGVTRNPWRQDRSAGGSSGGTGAAVAAGLAGVGLGSDGGGSIRIPSACCGLFGLKTQRARVSLLPFDEHWYGLSVYGPIGRTVADAALLLDAIAAEAPERPYLEAARTPPGRLRIAVSTKPAVLARVAGDVKRAVQQTAELLRGLGHDVRERDPRHNPLLTNRLFLPRYYRGIYDDIGTLARPERLERKTRALGRFGRLTGSARVDKARQAEAGFTERMGEVFRDHDVLLTPMMPFPPVEAGKFAGQGIVRTQLGASQIVAFAVPWNITGQPAASLPAGFTDDGLPLAVQLVGRPDDEATLLSLAAQIESERPWADRRPPLD